MARARNIKPSIMDNEELAELGALHRLLFIYLWMLADREGRLEDRPKRIAAQALPYDRSADVGEMLDDLCSAGFIARYTASGKSCIQIVSFSKHQSPHGTEKDSDLPGADGVLTVHTRGKNGYATGEVSHSNGDLTVKAQEPNKTTTVTPPSDNALIPDSGYLIPDTGLSDSKNPAGAGDAPATKVKGEYPEDFEDAWSAYPQRPGASKADAHKAWKARLKEGVDAAVLIDGVRRYAAYCTACKTEPGYVKQPATFFGPGEHYLADWTPPVRAAPRAPANKHAAAAAAIFDMDYDCQPATRPAEDVIDV